MREENQDWLDRLEEYIELFRDDFRRRDQIRWASVYLQGLLLASSPKTIEAMARLVLLSPDRMVDDVAQALQNFVNQSPWDENKLWRRHRQMHQAQQAHPDSFFVLQDLAFVKQGRHSIGVQRQYSGLLGRKTNCQIAVSLAHLSPAGLCPLALRLYLPRTWLQDSKRLERTGVPEEFCTPQTRGSIALSMLDQVDADGWRAPLVLASPGLAADPALRDGLEKRGHRYAIQAGPVATHSANWRFQDSAWISNLLVDSRPRFEWPLVRAVEQVRKANQIVHEELGLDHFEGRSWRGFHHHACLVMLAFSFRHLQFHFLQHSHSSMI
jgi:SRSO17 transposase